MSKNVFEVTNLILKYDGTQTIIDKWITEKQLKWIVDTLKKEKQYSYYGIGWHEEYNYCNNEYHVNIKAMHNGAGRIILTTNKHLDDEEKEENIKRLQELNDNISWLESMKKDLDSVNLQKCNETLEKYYSEKLKLDKLV